MAVEKKVSELPTVTSADGTDVMVVNAAGTTSKISLTNFTGSQLAYVSVNTNTNAITVGGTGIKSGYYLNCHTTETTTPITYTLPTAEAGMQFCIKNGYGDNAACSGALYASPAATDYIEAAGTLGGQGKDYRSSGAAGDYVMLVCYKTNYWSVIGSVGSWSFEA